MRRESGTKGERLEPKMQKMSAVSGHGASSMGENIAFIITDA